MITSQGRLLPRTWPHTVDPRKLWAVAKREPAAFWLLGLYLVFEYLRPQLAYPAIDFIPWGQATIGACLLALLMSGGLGRRAPVILDIWVAAFFVWTLVSATQAWDSTVAWQDWSTVASWALLYFLVTSIVVTPTRIVLFWWLFLLINLKMSQHGARSFAVRGFTFTDWGVTGSPGWFQNSGEFAMQMAGFTAICWFFLASLRSPESLWRRRALVALFPGMALLCVVASSSRGGQLAAALVLLGIVFATRVRLRNVVAVLMVAAAGWFVLPEAQKARFETMGADETSESRLTYWEDAWAITKANPVTGIGYRNWPPFYGARTNNARPEVIHNTTLEASTELGFPGLFFFLGAILTSFLLNARSRKASRRADATWRPVLWGMAAGLDVGMLGFLVAAQFMSVLFYPIFWLHFAMTTALAATIVKSPPRSLQVHTPARRRVEA